MPSIQLEVFPPKFRDTGFRGANQTESKNPARNLSGAIFDQPDVLDAVMNNSHDSNIPARYINDMQSELYPFNGHNSHAGYLQGRGVTSHFESSRTANQCRVGGPNALLVV